jgi:hypothetical protein
MDMKSEQHYLDDIPAYAIGALDADTQQLLESHMNTCELCQNELAAYLSVSNILLTALPPVAPPIRLRRNLQNRLPAAPIKSSFASSFSIPKFAFGFLVVLLLGLNLFSLLQIRTLKQEQETMRTQLENGRMVLAMLSYPETNTIPITDTNIAGTILVDVERNAAVILTWDMPKLDPGQTYQIWLITPDGRRTSGGIFNADPVSPFTSSPVSVPDNLDQYSGLGVTIEPAGGSPQPTGDRVFKIDF